MGWGEEAEESGADLEHHRTVRATWGIAYPVWKKGIFWLRYPVRNFWVGTHVPLMSDMGRQVPLVYHMGRRAIEADLVFFLWIDGLDLRGVEMVG